MAHLVTGYAGTEHIQSADQGSFNAAFFGTGQFVMEIGNSFNASITTNNNVRILDGDLLMYGRHIRINPDTYEDLTIQNGTVGKNRIDLIVMTYEKNTSTGVETANLEVIKGTESTGTASEPSYTSGNILEGATKNQMPLYAVNVEGVVLSNLKKKFTTCPTYKKLAEQYEAEFITSCNNHLNSLNILDSGSGITGNTSSNQLSGALGVKELYNTLNTAVNGKAASNHTHDDRYYTESEMDTRLAAKANSSHTHDDRYYTESEMNTKLNGKLDVNAPMISTGALRHSILSDSGNTQMVNASHSNSAYNMWVGNPKLDKLILEVNEKQYDVESIVDNYLTTKSFDFSISNIAAWGTSSTSIDITLSGYTAVAIAGVSALAPSSANLMTGSTKACVSVSNISSGTAKISGTVYVLYRKNI